jgi:uncharacterized SAM-binding protein YcdF (DUF218 family)
MWWVALVLLLAAAFSAWRDPRKLRIGLALLGALSAVVLAGLGAGLAWVNHLEDQSGAWTLLLGIEAMLAMVVVLGGVLVLNGLTMVRREGRSPGNLLSLLLGLAILGYVGLATAAVAASLARLFVLVAFVGLPLAYLAFGFVGYLLYSWLYLTATGRFGRPVGSVVVLGSGLIDGRVPPLLASRLDRGLAAFEKARAAGLAPVLVTSGGRGPDEPRAEAEAMAEYVTQRGVEPGSVIVEDRSRTTHENLARSAELLGARGVGGDVAVVTNNFHAFRAALLMRRLGIPGYSLGSPTANYYWPSATIREYVAILRDSLVLNVVCLVLACVPLAVLLVSWALVATGG